MVKTWVRIPATKVRKETIALLGQELLGIVVLDAGLSPSGNPHERNGVTQVNFLKPFALPISQVEEVLAIACRAVEIAEDAKP